MPMGELSLITSPPLVKRMLPDWLEPRALHFLVAPTAAAGDFDAEVPGRALPRARVSSVSRGSSPRSPSCEPAPAEFSGAARKCSAARKSDSLSDSGYFSQTWGDRKS